MNKKQINVLLVEDGEGDYYLTKKMFSQIKNDYTYTVTWASTAEEGYRLCHSREHDIYFIDYSLGAETGINVIERLHKSGHSGPFVMLTGFDSRGLYEASLKLGIYDYILKDELSPSKIERTVTYAIHRKQIEKALQSEKEYTSFIVSKIPYIIINLDRDFRIVGTNDYTETLTGYTQKKLVGQPWSEVFSGEEHRNFSGMTPHDNFETKVTCVNGLVAHVVWNVLKLNGQYILIGKDITALMRQEEKERQRQKMEALGHLSGGMAHEINNLLQPILMSSEILLSNDNIEASALKRYLSIQSNAQKAAQIIDEIVTFAVQDTNTTTPLPFINTIKESLVFCNDILPARIQLDMSELDVDWECTVYANKSDLIRIISNLFLNSVAAIQEQGQITVKARQIAYNQAEASEKGLSSGLYAQLSIHDNGVGIHPKHLDVIFNPFFTTRAVGQGSGLGLSTVYSLLRGWNGGVTVESIHGEETTFFLYIPVAETMPIEPYQPLESNPFA